MKWLLKFLSFGHYKSENDIKRQVVLDMRFQKATEYFEKKDSVKSLYEKKSKTERLV